MSKVRSACAEDKSIACPFYRWQDKNRIACEGTTKHNTISLIFGDSNAKLDHRARHCRSINGYKGCRVAQMLYQKYADKE